MPRMTDEDFDRYYDDGADIEELLTAHRRREPNGRRFSTCSECNRRVFLGTDYTGEFSGTCRPCSALLVTAAITQHVEGW